MADSTRNLWANSNGHNFSLECLITSHNISRRSKLNMELLTRMFDCDPYSIEMLKIENESCRQIQTVITFVSDVQLWPIIYIATQNWTWNLQENSNDNNF